MRKLLLVFVGGLISLMMFGQRIEMTSLDYHKGGLLVSKNEHVMFVKNLNEVELRYEKLISDIQGFTIEEYTQGIDSIKSRKVFGYFLGHENCTYEYFGIPEFVFRASRINDTLSYQLILNIQPIAPAYINLAGFTRTFNSLKEFSDFVKLMETYQLQSWTLQDYLGDKLIPINEKNDNLKLIPYYGHTILRDSPKGDRIDKVKISIRKTEPVIVLNEGVKFKSEDFLKVSYKGNIGWVSIRSFKDADVYAIRNNKCIVWMDNENVNF